MGQFRTDLYRNLFYVVYWYCVYDISFCYICLAGGAGNSTSSITGGRYTSGLTGCILQAQMADSAGQLTVVRLQEQAVGGAGITSCPTT